MAREHDRQRKLQRKSKKASKRRERAARPRRTSLSLGAERGLDEALGLLDGGKYDQAIVVLEELARRYPGRPEILSRLAEAYLNIGDPWSYQANCERLAAADPREPTSWLVLASAAIMNGQPAAAHRALQHAVTNWPHHPEIVKSLETLNSLEEFLAEECRRLGLDETIGHRVLVLHDEINQHLHRGNFDKTCEAATRLLVICPTFAPALNNRSEALFRSGRYPEAIADSRRVLEFDATNYHALANLARYLFLSGRFDEAGATAAKLKACDSQDRDSFVKKAETFAVLGDWKAILEAAQAGEAVWAEDGGIPGLVEHLAGVALANMGDLKAARKRWQRAITRADPIEWADENLKDSKRPLGKRHGPWAFPLEHWIPRGVIEELAESVTGRARTSDVKQIVQCYFERHPQLELIADTLVERSDSAACEMLIRLAPLVERPAIFAALKKFALGQRGSDDLRMRALMAVSQAGYVEGQVEMWRDGELHPVGLVSQEIFCEPMYDLPPEVHDWMVSGHAAIRDGRGAEAEQFFDAGLRLMPDNVSLQFNRAVAIGMQGREDEALAIVRRIHDDDPDYVFARTHLAVEHIANGNLEEAKTMLAPIMKRPRLHVSEYGAWCSANIDLALSEGELDAARKLLQAWKKLDPDNQQIKVWNGRIRGMRGLFGRLSAKGTQRVRK